MEVLRIALTLILLHLAVHVQSHLVEKRRDKPRINKAITLEELHLECIQHSWVSCSIKAEQMLSNTSNQSTDFRQCVDDAIDARKKELTLDLTKDNAIDDSPLELILEDRDVNITTSTPKTTASIVIPADCPLTVKIKAIARSEYCSIFQLISYKIKGVISILRTLVTCVEGKLSPGYFTPDEVRRKIEIWHDNLVRRHSCCSYLTEVQSYDSSRTYHNCNQRNIDEYQWSETLAIQAKYMRMAEALEGLGRRRKCLRGCVGSKEVRCSRFFR